MTNNTIFNALMIALSLAALVSFASLRAQSTTQKKPTRQTSVSAPVEKDREAVIRTKLGVLLSNVDLTVGSQLQLSNASTYKELRIQWESSRTNSTEFVKRELSTEGVLKSLSSAERTGALPRERSLELSPDHMLVVALDENEAVRWWRLMRDPRLVRAEVGEHTGMHSENYYLAKVDFIIECPDDPLLREVRFFQPVWNGEEFRLELLGVAPLN